ncbi:MAG: sensor histidine kinase [Flavobacteriales bacterium]|jgi:two-component system NarL family sensor kinase|nr:sensor histidine kinase [Flavobacteriales bacterium]MBK9513545.1 sensor histidine kinase [Flavobacteriales bacterium]
MLEAPPNEAVELVLTVLFGTLLMLVLSAVVVVLMVANRNRQNRHRAQLAEVRAQHAEEVRRVEREMVQQTLTEVGRELHDNIGQLLTVVRMGLGKLTAQVPNDAPAQQVKEYLDTTITEVRRLSRSLNVDRFADRALGDAITEECERVRRIGSVEVDLRITGTEPAFPADRKLVLFRLFQEALNNVLKHAKATRVEVRLDHLDPTQLVVRDNGVGFDPQATGAAGQGLVNMQRRATLIGARCSIDSTLGKGTELRFELDPDTKTTV